MKAWTLRIAAEYNEAMAHEGPVFNEKTNTLFFTSNRLHHKNGNQYVVVSQYDPNTGITDDLGLSNAIPMANGAVEINPDEIAFTMQGDLSTPAGIAIFNHSKNKTRLLINNANGQEFNSSNDIVITDDDILLFTDPTYGFEQNFRPKPELGNWVWSVDLQGENLRMIADGFSKPNGLALNKNQDKLLVTDTGYYTGDGQAHPERPRTIYSYALEPSAQNPSLSNKTVLNIATQGIPDGIKIDASGNIWTGTQAGVEMLNKHGSLQEIIPINGGISNLTFAGEKKLYLLGETRLWTLDLATGGRRNKIFGSRKSNHLDGSAWDDRIQAGHGNDIINAASGDDQIKGGKGNDTFILSLGKDVILDYDIGETIQINRDVFGQNLTFQQMGDDLNISSSTGLNSLLLNTSLDKFQTTEAIQFI